MSVFPPHVLQLAQCPSPGAVLRTWSAYAQETFSGASPAAEYAAVSLVTKKLSSFPSIDKGIGMLLGSARREHVRIGYDAVMALAEEVPADPLIAGLAMAIRIELPLPCADRVQAAMKRHLETPSIGYPRKIPEIFEEYKIDAMDMQSVKAVVDLIKENAEGADLYSLEEMFCFLDGFDLSVRGNSKELTGMFPQPLRDDFSALRRKLHARLLKDYKAFMKVAVGTDVPIGMHAYDKYQFMSWGPVDLFIRACMSRDRWGYFEQQRFSGSTLGEMAISKIGKIIEMLEKETTP
jgi:hypothetical protein